MPPTKAKLHSKSGKLKTITNNTPHTQNPGASASTSSQSVALRDSDSDRQFELELCWCIQQLQTSITSGKLNEKQMHDTEKTLKILKSGNQPLIKKRQLMRSNFGDYRAKMVEEEKKMSLGSKSIKFKAITEINKKSFFIKKSVFITTGEKDFKFNFPIDEINKLNISDGSSEIQNEENCKSLHQNLDYHYTPSGNSFKFNFNIN